MSEWVATVRVDVTSCAFPPATGTVARTVAPSLKVAVPSEGARVDGDAGVTVAVRVTGFPCTEGLGEEVSAVDVAAWDTAWLRAGETLLPKLASPA